MGPAEWGAVLVVIAVVLYYLRIFQRLRAVLVFLGVMLTAGGLLGSLLARTAVAISHLTDSLIGRIFGVTVPGLIVVVLAIIFVHDLHPRGGGASRRTFWIGLALAAFLVAGVSTFSQLNGLPSNVRTAVTSVSTAG